MDGTDATAMEGRGNSVGDTRTFFFDSLIFLFMVYISCSSLRASERRFCIFFFALSSIWWNSGYFVNRRFDKVLVMGYLVEKTGLISFLFFHYSILYGHWWRMLTSNFCD